MNAVSRYSTVAIILHWTIAVVIIGQIIGGVYMHELPDDHPNRFALYQLHKSFGICVLLLTLFRLVWRFTHPVPPLPTAMKSWERLAARGTHIAFYLLMVLVPLAGWAMVSASPYAASVPTMLFGAVPWPHLPFFDGVADRKELAHQFAEVHETLAFIFVPLLVLHIGAALKHQFVDKDGVLASMLPFVSNKSGGSQS